MAIITLVTQDEIIQTLTVDDHLSVNNITDSTIKKGELYLFNSFLGEAFYTDLLATKTATATFSNAYYQSFYDNYLLRLISEYVMMSSVIEIVLKLANSGTPAANTENSDKIGGLKYYKLSLEDEILRSKDMIHSFLTSETNRANFGKYLGNQSTSTDVKIKSKSFAGFLIESNIEGMNY